MLEFAKRILSQSKHDSEKVDSVHEPQPQCIAKGETGKQYAFGDKASLAVTRENNWVVGALSFTGEFKCWAYLEQAMHTGTNDEQLESADQKSIFRQRYRGDKHKGLESVSVDPLRRGAISKWLWQLIKQRAAIEPTIGRMKGENPRERNRLKGTC